MTHRTTSWNAPYTFSGKEKDVETGYGYFGARYYDSGLSIWLSVDPMSDKYPSMSPYNYCANNPVKLIDPNGMEIDEAATKKDPPHKNWLADSQKKTSDVKTPYVDPQSSQQGNTSSQSESKATPTTPSTPTSPSQQNSSQKNGHWGFGISFDVTGALAPIGVTGEVGFLWDSQGDFSFFKSKGTAAGGEASIGLNVFVIPMKNFDLKQFEGEGMNISANLSPTLFSTSIFSDFSHGAERDYYFQSYGGSKIGLGLGIGGSIQHTQTTLTPPPKIPNSPLWFYFQMCPI